MITAIDNLAEMVKTHADMLFPDRNDASMFLKIYSETGEVIEAQGDKEKHDLEVADIFILWLDYAKRKGVDIEHVVRAKLNMLHSREWKRDENGVYSHVKGPL